MTSPPILKAGDTIYLTSPAKAIEESVVLATKKILETWGLEVIISQHCLGRHHYFSGTDDQRLADFQWGLDHPNINAILCTRGGYGSVRIVNELDWKGFTIHPKWIIGFSDVTVFHHKALRLGFQSIHGIMPLGFCEGTADARRTLRSALFGEHYRVEFPTNPRSRKGKAEGRIIGGNMTIVFSLLATSLAYSFEDKILFLEDVGEHVYKIDRMLYALKMAGAFSKIKGLVLGGFTEIEDTDVPFGTEVSALILSQVEHLDIPVAFDFPAGHISDNRALILGSNVVLSVGESSTSLLI